MGKHKSVIVTGGAGFIGSHLVEKLLHEGWRVTIVDNFDPFYSEERKRENIEACLNHAQCRLVEVDVRDAAALESALDGDYDVLVHLAAKAGIRPSIVDPVSYQAVNVQGTQNLLEFARQREIRQFVFASSSSVYGINPHVPWSEEDHVLQPISPYASTKVSGELLGHVYSHLYDIRFIALRLFTVYGPRQRPDLVLHKFARLILTNQPIPLFGDGSSRRDYTYVLDIIAGIRAAMTYEGSMYEIFNLGSGTALSLEEMVASLETSLDVTATRKYLPMQQGDVPQTWASVAKATARLGYAPATAFHDGVAHFSAWFLRTQRVHV